MEQLGLTKHQKQAEKDKLPTTAFIMDENYMANAVRGQEESKDHLPLQRRNSQLV